MYFHLEFSSLLACVKRQPLQMQGELWGAAYPGTRNCRRMAMVSLCSACASDGLNSHKRAVGDDFSLCKERKSRCKGSSHLLSPFKYHVPGEGGKWGQITFMTKRKWNEETFNSEKREFLYSGAGLMFSLFLCVCFSQGELSRLFSLPPHPPPFEGLGGRRRSVSGTGLF